MSQKLIGSATCEPADEENFLETGSVVAVTCSSNKLHAYSMCIDTESKGQTFPPKKCK